MTTPHFPDAPAAYTPSEDEAPSFDEMRAGGCMIIDDSLQKLAVYPGGGGCVVLKEQHFDSPVHHVIVDEKFVPVLIAALTKAATESAEIEAQAMAVAVAQWEEYERLMKGAKLVLVQGGAAGA